MSEITFAKAFLATLDKKPIKLAADHITDPRSHPNQSPYTLPRATHPYPRKPGPTTTQAHHQTVTVTLKPMRTGPTTTLPAISLDTTIHEIKTQYAAQAGLQQDKIKLLWNKKPAGDLKTLKDLGVDGGGDGSGEVELSVMLMAGATLTTGAHNPQGVVPPPPPSSSATPADPMDVDPQTSAPESEKAAAEVVQSTGAGNAAVEEWKSEEFWADLEGFLSQRLRDEGEGKRLVGLFRAAAVK